MTRRALLLLGRGRYEDPWHDYAATAQRVAAVLAGQGVQPELRSLFPDALAGARPGGEDQPAASRADQPTEGAADGERVGVGDRPTERVGVGDRPTERVGVGDRPTERTAETPPGEDHPWDLVVVLAGRGRTDPGFDGDDDAWVPFHDQLAALVAGGTALLGIHAAANTFADHPGWPELLGGRWVPGTSMHPPIGPAIFRPTGRDHPVTRGLPPVETYDERYCRLVVAPTSEVLLTTEHDGVSHPVVWAASPAGADRPGLGRVLYDGLGHDVRSYDSPTRRELLAREVAWLLRRA
ncbi:ThuA domain-containing protein [Georgenia sp. TF02-10]|uniref:ThuA domain-containing protein n=1 Tax=Georgenia sp. TF02-10 TaxID=2917725 RepID=UPI001FA7B1FA|nr:ThuA domain-containing protein [Georgenia sp. TF02-10]UNX53727.1 ThuA domain-containing protein [Georgenia sp. TF02-10]